MPKQINLKEFGLVPGGDIGKALKKASYDLFGQRVLSSESKIVGGQIKVDPGRYILLDDVPLYTSGTTFDFTGSVIQVKNDASFLLGSQHLVGLQDHWSKRNIWTESMRTPRQSFSPRLANGKRAAMHNYNALASIDEWSTDDVITFDLCIGRDAVSNDTTQMLFGFNGDFNEQKIPWNALITKTDGPRVEISFMLEDPYAGPDSSQVFKFRDTWSIPISNLFNAFPRMDISIEYNVKTQTLRAWVNRSRVSAIRRSGVPISKSWKLTNNSRMLPFSLPHVGTGNLLPDLVYHGFRISLGKIYADDNLGDTQKNIANNNLSDHQVFGQQANSKSIVFSMIPENEGRYFVSRAPEGRTRTRVISSSPAPFPANVNNVIVKGLTLTGYSNHPSSDTGKYLTGMIVTNGNHVIVKDVNFPDGCFSALQFLPGVTNKVLIDNIFAEKANCLFCVRSGELEYNQLTVNQFSRTFRS